MAVSYADIDKAMAKYPGASSVRVSVADFGSLIAANNSNATVPGHKKHIVYTHVSQVPLVLNIKPDINVRPNDVYVEG